jgi:hypothetical protein
MNVKCVIVIDRDLPPGLAANAAAALGMSLGAQVDGLIGPDVADADGVVHRGITKVNLPVLMASSGELTDLFSAIVSAKDPDVAVIGFSRLAQSCKSYDIYRDRMNETHTPELGFSGICVHGDHKKVSRLTGSLPVLK